MAGPKLAQFHTPDKDLALLQSNWASSLNPVLSNPSLQSLLIKNVSLTVGPNVINHRLGRLQQGWRIVDMDAFVQVFRTEPFNDLTLTLNADTDAIVSIEVF